MNFFAQICGAMLLADGWAEGEGKGWAVKGLSSRAEGGGGGMGSEGGVEVWGRR